MRRYGRSYGRSGGFFTRLFVRLFVLAFAVIGLLCLIEHASPIVAVPQAVAGFQHVISAFHTAAHQ
jgi:hypothetical protein